MQLYLRFILQTYIKHVKESRNSPGVDHRVTGGLGSKNALHSAHEGGEVISLTHRPPSPPRDVTGIHFHQRLSLPQGHAKVGRNMSLKNPVTPPGIDPRTVRLVALRLNPYATPGPLQTYEYVLQNILRLNAIVQCICNLFVLQGLFFLLHLKQEHEERERFLHHLRTYRYGCVNTVILFMYEIHAMVWIPLHVATIMCLL